MVRKGTRFMKIQLKEMEDVQAWKDVQALAKKRKVEPRVIVFDAINEWLYLYQEQEKSGGSK